MWLAMHSITELNIGHQEVIEAILSRIFSMTNLPDFINQNNLFVCNACAQCLVKKWLFIPSLIEYAHNTIIHHTEEYDIYSYCTCNTSQEWPSFEDEECDCECQWKMRLYLLSITDSWDGLSVISGRRTSLAVRLFHVKNRWMISRSRIDYVSVKCWSCCQISSRCAV